MEELLTANEIAAVLKEAGKPEYSEDNLFNFTFKKLDIFKVSAKGLIFIHGDDHTGMEHIRDRHSIVSRKLYEKDGTFDNPTKFNLAPIEYPFVADAIFIEGNLNNDKNKRPELFDCYTGDFKHRDERIFRYTLILYKATNVVHTFFLSSAAKPFNKKVKLPVRQGWSGGQWDVMSGLQTFSLNYLDLNDIIRFTLVLRCIPAINKERWYLTVNDSCGKAIFTHYLKEVHVENFIDTPIRMGILDFQDLSEVDKKIKNIIKGKYEFEKGFNNFCYYNYLN
ncbi:hypothetical protein [Pedobacter soli]|uniref:Uncharacterized protein n=1 Tax=Pedobacter soli TaxID=390242 RepID=A0A1G6WMI3_9SPHI|nr:hypothetical protein [Pedobacter soli]SDD66296.1 hypothetical protein SAMN04488024_10748 [Pedobacter soli]